MMIIIIDADHDDISGVDHRALISHIEQGFAIKEQVVMTGGIV